MTHANVSMHKEGMLSNSSGFLPKAITDHSLDFVAKPSNLPPLLELASKFCLCDINLSPAPVEGFSVPEAMKSFPAGTKSLGNMVNASHSGIIYPSTATMKPWAEESSAHVHTHDCMGGHGHHSHQQCGPSPYGGMPMGDPNYLSNSCMHAGIKPFVCRW